MNPLFAIVGETLMNVRALGATHFGTASVLPEVEASSSMSSLVGGDSGGSSFLSGIRSLSLLLDSKAVNQIAKLLCLTIATRLAHEAYLLSARSINNTFRSSGTYKYAEAAARLYDKFATSDVLALAGQDQMTEAAVKILGSAKDSGYQILSRLMSSWDRPATVDKNKRDLFETRDRWLRDQGFLSKSSFFPASFQDSQALFRRSQGSLKVLNALKRDVSTSGKLTYTADDLDLIIDSTSTAILASNLAIIQRDLGGAGEYKISDELRERNIRISVSTIHLIRKAALYRRDPILPSSSMIKFFSVTQMFPKP